MPQSDFSDLQPKVVLAVGAHPDDMDFGAAGTLAAFAGGGAAVHYLQLTDGGKGSADPNMNTVELIKIRQQEQLAACQAIGGQQVHFLNHPDGCLEVTLELKAEIVKVIRTVKPDVVITMDPSMLYSIDRGFINHPDHRAAGQATLDAVYPLARDHLSFPELYAEGYQPHKVKTVLLINFEKHNYYVDTTDTIEKKFEALRAHQSQIPDYESMKRMFTGFSREAGKKAGFEYAEGFIRLDIRP